MMDEKAKILIDLEVRIRQLFAKCDALQNQNTQLKEEKRMLNNKIAEAEKNQHQLKEKYDSLKTARTITAASVDVEVARAKLSKMVREVDKCINLLK